MYIYLCSAGAEYGLQCGFSRLVKVDPEIGLRGCGISITDSCYLSGRLVVQFAWPRYRTELWRCHIDRPQFGGSFDWLHRPQVERDNQESYRYVWYFRNLVTIVQAVINIAHSRRPTIIRSLEIDTLCVYYIISMWKPSNVLIYIV